MLTVLGFAVGTAFAAEETTTNNFGFAGKEIFPVENQISQLKAADIDGDGLQDLVVVNNARSKITILYNQTGKTNIAAKDKKIRRELNELPPDSRFRIDSIASEKRISSLVVADLNSDGKPDIAYYGEPKELVVQYNEGGGKWSALKRFPIEDGTTDPYALVFGDLNGDKRTDLLLLADNTIYFLAQKPDNTLAEPEKIPYIGSVKSIQVLDIQGDGRDDLLLVNWDNPVPFRFRLQGENGKLGPEMHFSLPPIRSYWADDLDNDHKTEIVTIAQKSGRAQIANFTQKSPEDLSGDWKLGQFQIMPLTRTTKSRRGAIWADLNNDKRSDLIVAEPESGQLTVYFQKDGGALDKPQVFPTFTGVSDLLAADWEGDGKTELFVLSNDERQIGVTTFTDKGNLTFPKIILMEGRPLVMAAGNGLEYKGKPALAAITDNDGKRELQIRTSDGQRRTQKLNEAFKSNPTSLIVHDVNQDGLPDLVILIPYEKIKVLLGVKDKEDFQEIDVSPPGGTAEQPWVTSADVDGDGKPELLLAQRNFLRAVVLKPQGEGDSSSYSFAVKEQINGAGSNSRIVAATPIAQGDRKVPALFLLDAERKSLTVTERNTNNVWIVVRNIPLPVTDFTQMNGVALGGSDQNSVSLVGLNSAAWLNLQGDVWQFDVLDGYETPVKDGFLHDVVSGDLNGDGRKDLVFLETSKSYVDLVTYEPPHNLVPANRWQVFEERTFRSRRNELAEPREAIVAEMTGDGKNDLVVIVHDRILLYPQE
jgi:hypothetical protein